jgi:hypothetical protein
MIWSMGKANIILLTAAVDPDPRFGSVVSASSERLGQYRRAVHFWSGVAEDSGYELAIVETTGSNLLRDQAPLISFTATDALVTRGKGAVEAAALDYALSVIEPASESAVVKVTGRLIVKNAIRLVRPLPENAIRARRTLDRGYCDSRFFVASAGFWADHLHGMAEEVRDGDGRYLEHVLAHRMSNAEFANGARVERFPERPSFLGTSGTSGTRYGSVLDRVKSPSIGIAERMLFRQLARKQV